MKTGNRLALTLVLSFGAASPAALAQTPKKGGILSFAIVAEPPTYDCHATTTFATLHPVRPHYSGLLKFTGDVNKKLEVKGDLAESFEAAKDGLTYTFKLRRQRQVP